MTTPPRPRVPTASQPRPGRTRQGASPRPTPYKGDAVPTHTDTHKDTNTASHHQGHDHDAAGCPISSNDAHGLTAADVRTGCEPAEKAQVSGVHADMESAGLVGSRRVVGVDLSLTSTGVATVAGVVRLVPAKGLTGLDRLRWLRSHVLELVGAAPLVVLEGLAFGSTTGKASERAGLWWLIVDTLAASGVPVAVAPPTTRCRYATGRGNAPKDAVLASAVRRFPDVDVTGNDQADALWLRAMGCEYLGVPLVDLPLTHRQALAGVQWPEHPAPAVAGAA